MGLFDLLSKDGRAKGTLQRSLARVADKNAQSPDRFAAMEKLKEIGTDEAIHGLARRFSFTYDKGIEDEQEKEWVCAALIGMGERAVGGVRQYALETDSLSFPLRVLEAIAPTAKMLTIVDDILKRDEPGYTRDPSKKIQIMTWLAEWTQPGPAEIAKRVVPYLGDFDEGVRFAAIDALAHQHDEVAAAPLLACMLRPEEESRRIKVRCAEVLAAGEWKVTDRKEEVQRVLDSTLPEFHMQHDKLIKKAKEK